MFKKLVQEIAKGTPIDEICRMIDMHDIQLRNNERSSNNDKDV